MAKKIVEESPTPATKDCQSLIRAAGCSKLWDAQPRNQPFSVSCWLTPNRRLILLQEYHDGPTNTFEEVTKASFEDGIKRVLSA